VKESLFLTLAEVVEIHADQIERYGGESGIRDMRLLESAVAQPLASFAGERFYHDHYEMASAYAFHISQNHPFLDGNKRTALASALVFLKTNGITIFDPRGQLLGAMKRIASNRMKKQEFADSLRRLIFVRA
jgi:death-on-curing protein